MLANYESINQLIDRLNSLNIFEGNVSAKKLKLGMNNETYLLSDNNNKYVAKIGSALVDFQRTRLHEIEATKAGNIANIAPKVIYYEKEIAVFEYIKSSALTTREIKQKNTLQKIVSLIKTVHKEVTKYFTQPPLISWYFCSITESIKILKNKNTIYVDRLDQLFEESKILEEATGYHEIVFTHNDMVGANILNDGKKLWLIDWEFSGYNFAILDLANLSKNNQFDEEEDDFILEEYFSNLISLSLRYNFEAMKSAALLRETMWSMLAEIKSKNDFDYKSYTDKIYARYKKQLDYFKSLK